MTEFNVNWAIELDANSFEDAAKKGRKFQFPGTEALHFKVTQSKSDETQEIDLMEINSREKAIKALVDIQYRIGETEVDTTVLLVSKSDDLVVFHNQLKLFLEQFQDSLGSWDGDCYWCNGGEFILSISNTTILTHDEFLALKNYLSSKVHYLNGEGE